jgi:hypothetical protein
VIWALPLHRFLVAAILLVLASIGFEIARRQTVAELEVAEPAPVSASKTPPWRKPVAAPTQIEELERLAKLRSEDLLTDEEYAAAKGRLLPPA